MTTTARTGTRTSDYGLEDDPLWYRDAIIYELHVRSFLDSDGDGVGDFRGLTDKLDYLQDLGVTALWLLPFYPSPLRDDGYDISDYTSVHPMYGNLRDFQVFLREAHRRGLRVITELVLNHTSDQHAWFERARRARPGHRYRDFFVWSDTPDRYREARLIFKDFESSNWAWDPTAKSYYWHRFYHHQPDLNFDSPAVRRAMFRVVDHWFGLGVDGLRLDAVPYLYERDGTSCENLPETHAYLRALRAHVDAKFPNRMLLAEANQWPDDAAAYFGQGDECHMAFHFPLMPRLFMAIRMEDRFPVVDILRQTPAIPEAAQWALFLRNHDELTLEMVTDEDRDYMYRTYASDPEARINLGIRRRLAPLLGNHRRKMELMNGLLLALPGTPVIYYGDELGMGDNIYLGDRDGVRTPMQWSSDRNAGFSRANPQRLYLPVIIDPEYHYETVNVEAQQANPHSLLWWMKRIIALRKRHKAFGRGSIEFLYPENARILAFIREYEDEHILVVANLSRFVQAVELDLTRFRGATPIEMFGRTHLPPVGEAPYFLTLGPHAFYWFILQARTDSIMAEPNAAGRTIPTLTTSGSWTTVFRGRAVSNLTALLPEYLRGRRWFGGKARTIQTVHVVDAVPIGGRAGREPKAFLALLSVEYREGEPETYMLPLGLARGERSEALMQEAPQAIVARIESRTDGGTGILFDASLDEEFGETLLSAIARGRSFEGTGKLTASPTPALRRIRSRADGPLCPTVLRAEQSNTSIVYGDKLILKLFRRPERGINPDLELGRFITERTKMRHVPQVAGYIEYRAGRSEPMTLAILQAYVPNEGDAWRYTIDELDRYFERVLALGTLPDERLLPRQPMALLAASPTPSAAEDAIGAYLESARLLGQRTAELHLALASSPEDKNLAPEPFTPFYQRSLFQSMRNLTAQMLSLLRRSIDRLPEAAREEGLRIAELEPVIIERFQRINQSRLNITRIRCHGDYHLGQVLYTGNDFVIIDFEGEPARPLSERRLKRSPLRDVAGMLRSFHYAAYTALLEADGAVRDEDRPMLESWARVWHTWVSATFLRAYLETAAGASFLPADSGDLVTLLDAFIMEKAVYELGYELNNRPEWVRLPLQGILQLLEEGSS